MEKNKWQTFILNVTSFKFNIKLCMSANIITHFLKKNSSTILHSTKEKVRQVVGFKNVLTKINVDTKTNIIYHNII